MNLEELKQKWFIDTSDQKAFPPQGRHPGSSVADHTDGNLVEPLIDGAAIMGYFDGRVEQLLSSEDPRQGHIWLAAMGIEAVKLRGQTSDSKDAIARILEAAEKGVNVTYLGSGQGNLGSHSKKFAAKLAERGSQGAVDRRFPFLSGHHQKFNVTHGGGTDWEAVVSSADFFLARWDDPQHRPENADRPKGPTHDFGFKVKGPAVRDIGLTFADRWNDQASSHLTSPKITTTLDTGLLDTAVTPVGSHSVQVLRTYHRRQKKKGKGYSWSDVGEFTVWASYINAIKQAQQYIYIEDQYLYPLGDPPFIYGGNGRERETDFVFQLGEALKRGVDVIALVPSRNNSIVKHYENQQRRRATEYLHNISTASPGAGRFVVVTHRLGDVDTTIHSKVMLVDDEFALAGSANICQRSIAFITEMHLGVLDAENAFVRDLRLALWQEHMELGSPDSIIDAWDAVGLLQETAAAGHGRLHLYPTQRYHFEFPYRPIMNWVIDPYKGPER